MYISIKKNLYSNKDIICESSVKWKRTDNFFFDNLSNL